MTRDEAAKRILAVNEPYKMEILGSIQDDSITIYHIGKWKFGFFFSIFFLDNVLLISFLVFLLVTAAGTTFIQIFLLNCYEHK